MANKVLGITLTLILHLSLNTTTDVNANIHNYNLNNRDYTFNLIIPEEQQDNILTVESENLVVDNDYILNSISDTDNMLNDEEQQSSSKEQESIRIIDPNKPMIALTYDDGPSKYTQELLEVLSENNSVATFFVLGTQVEKYEEAVIKTIDNGNQIGNHSFDHKKFTILSDDEINDQIYKTDKLVYATAYYRPFVMRPPYGSTSEDLIKKLQKPIIKWSIDTRDWENRNEQTIIDIILKNVKDGDIILMHDIYETSIEASKTVIPELIKRGYQLVTISELSEYREITLTAGKSYYQMYK